MEVGRRRPGTRGCRYAGPQLLSPPYRCDQVAHTVTDCHRFFVSTEFGTAQLCEWHKRCVASTVVDCLVAPPPPPPPLLTPPAQPRPQQPPHAHATSADEGVFPGESQSSESSDAWNGASVAVNVFWRCLPRAADHDPGDVFGNRDPPAARRAAELAAKAGASLASLPEPQRRFYARRAAKRLAEQLGYALDLSPT